MKIDKGGASRVEVQGRPISTLARSKVLLDKCMSASRPKSPAQGRRPLLGIGHSVGFAVNIGNAPTAVSCPRLRGRTGTDHSGWLVW